jgi:hypothetical protein
VEPQHIAADIRGVNLEQFDKRAWFKLLHITFDRGTHGAKHS